MKRNQGRPATRVLLCTAAALALLASGGRASAEDCGPITELPVLSSCLAVTPRVIHRQVPACPGRPDPFVVNQRLSLIENGTVPCLHGETGEPASCAFLFRSPRSFGRRALGTQRPAASLAEFDSRQRSRHDDDDDEGEDGDDGGGRGRPRDPYTCKVGGGEQAAYSGNWLKASDGNSYALIGQAIGLDGTPGGEYVIGARFTIESRPVPAAGAARAGAAVSALTAIVPCLGASGRDAATTPSGTELAAFCTIETLNWDTNRTCQLMVNVATLKVCTSSNPHPDLAAVVSADSERDVYCYIGQGAGLNDPTGTERDGTGTYYAGHEHCHLVISGGIETIAAKRPSTKTYPVPMPLDNTRVRWLPVAPAVTIANP